MTQTIKSLSKQTEKIKIQDNKNKKFRFSLKTFNRMLFLLIIICGVYYMASINDLSVKGFKLLEFKEKISQLNSENNKLELEVMSLGSYGNLNQRVERLNMVAVGEIDYIVGSEAVVAVQK